MTSTMYLIEAYRRPIKEPYYFIGCKSVDTFFLRLQTIIPASACILFEVAEIVLSVTSCIRRKKGRNVPVDIGLPQVADWVPVAWAYLRRKGLLAQKPPTVNEHFGRLRRARGMTPGLWAIATFGLLVSWASGIAIFGARREFQAAAGNCHKENEMGHGQTPASLIWLPVVVECVYFAVLHVSWRNLIVGTVLPRKGCVADSIPRPCSWSVRRLGRETAVERRSSRARDCSIDDEAFIVGEELRQQHNRR